MQTGDLAAGQCPVPRYRAGLLQGPAADGKPRLLLRLREVPIRVNHSLHA